ncbi:hypothetical protein ANCDUO_16927 [Ancylostoma duodenale]|uniref:Resistance to inhibitors of cholinesterase protein 3 N-terminal domain-containing protein n=1 Tax=Ancylostoma duodenale TaxID=51022 RepID=A0A0C2G239_9BILA|nr:hypothetical protein ANCDUO_16927 [Ancylostoma duodenale]
MLKNEANDHLKEIVTKQAETQSGGRGMFTWMLPLYTVGVVIFLLYTLFKSKGKKKRRSRFDSSDYSSDDGDEYNDRLKKKIGMLFLHSLNKKYECDVKQVVRKKEKNQINEFV